MYTPTVHTKPKKILSFQQDGATPHKAHATMAHFRTLFGNKIWSLKAELKWSPHSPDLAPLEFFFWDAAKQKCTKRSLAFLDS